MLSVNPTKICSKCFKEKTLADFPLRKRDSRDGFYAYCKRCKQDWLNNWYKSPKGFVSRASSRSKPTHLQKANITSKRNQAKSPEKYKARYTARNAVRAGKIPRLTKCEKCGSEKQVQLHHHLGYEFKNALKIQWLCVDCHRAQDRI